MYQDYKDRDRQGAVSVGRNPQTVKHAAPSSTAARGVILREGTEASWPCRKTRMDKTIRKYASFDEMKADEYRYWQSRPIWERTDAVSELTQEQYAMKGDAPDVPRLQRTLVRIERAPR
jgi:hypothetical protein